MHRAKEQRRNNESNHHIPSFRYHPENNTPEYYFFAYGYNEIENETANQPDDIDVISINSIHADTARKALTSVNEAVCAPL